MWLLIFQGALHTYKTYTVKQKEKIYNILCAIAIHTYEVIIIQKKEGGTTFTDMYNAQTIKEGCKSKNNYKTETQTQNGCTKYQFSATRPLTSFNGFGGLDSIWH